MKFIGFFLVLIGISTYAATRLRWAWFMNFYRVKALYAALGAKVAARLYGIISLILVFVGVLLMLGILQ
jgi:hypothetical protein